MKAARCSTLLMLLSIAAPLGGQDPAVAADLDEGFRLAGVRGMLESLPPQVQEMTAVAVAQFPRDQRRDFESALKDVNLKFFDSDAFYKQLQTYFVKHYDAGHMNTFLALERTPVYRTMHRLEESAETPAAQASRRRFEANLKSDPPDPLRVSALRRLEQARNAAELQLRIVAGIVNAVSVGLGAQLAKDMDPQSAGFMDRMRPLLANNVLNHYLFAFRNVDDATLEDYVTAAQQKDVAWFNRTLQAAIVAASAERAAKISDAIKTKLSQPVK